MAARLYLSEVQEDGAIIVQARAEGDGGIIGDAEFRVFPGGEVFGVPYETLRENAPGTVEVGTTPPGAR